MYELLAEHADTARRDGSDDRSPKVSDRNSTLIVGTWALIMIAVVGFFVLRK